MASLLAAIAHAAGLDGKPEPAPYSGGIGAAPAAAPVPAAPNRELSVPEQVIQNWKSDPEIRAEFGSLAIYAAWFTSKAAKEQGVSAQQMKARHPDLAGYLAKREGTLSAEEKLAIAGYAETWSSSPDIQAEFQTFEIFAAFSRAKARGNGKVFGQ